ncbi:MAG: flagellar basal body-associated FliL family protein [Alphaproteobacteria bacterium]|nr:flagellar basal body-associated FliL family protein [Alphaproteobacteria bacterium]
MAEEIEDESIEEDIVEDTAEDTEDTEENDENESQESDAKSKSSWSKKKLLMILLPILVILGAFVGLYFSGIVDMLLGGEKKEATEEVKEEELKETIFYDLPEMLVNLNTSKRKQIYLKIKVSLEVAKKSDIPRIEAVMPRIVDNFQVYLRELRIEDLQGAAGMYRLREELLSRVGKAAQPAEIVDILFKEMLIQ